LLGPGLLKILEGKTLESEAAKVKTKPVFNLSAVILAFDSSNDQLNLVRSYTGLNFLMPDFCAPPFLSDG
jgi:hypothetical protein